MGLVPLFDAGDIDSGWNLFEKNIDREILAKFQYAGEDFINQARDEGDYRNFTGNLRSSIGYMIGLDGRVIESSFPGNEAEGKNRGTETAKDIIRGFGSGYVLVVVAGMEYASAVESKGRLVLSKFSPGASKLLKKMFDE